MLRDFDLTDNQHFNELKRLCEFAPDSHLTDLIDNDEVMQEQSGSWLSKKISSLYPKNLGANGAAFSRQAQKALKRKFESWSEYLNDNLQESIFKEKELRKLKDLAKAIFNDKKTEWIRKKLKELQINNERLQNALKTFDKRIITILSHPELSSANRFAGNLALFGLNGPFPIPFYAAALIPAFAINPQRSSIPMFREFPLSESYLQEQADRTKKELELDQSMHRFAHLTPMHDPSWTESLIAAFLQSNQNRVGRHLNDIQALEIFKCALENQDILDKIPKLLTTLTFSTLIGVLVALNEHTIKLLNGRLKQCEIMKSKPYIEEFIKRRQEFAKLCNEKKSEIDDLNAELRVKVQEDDYLRSNVALLEDLQKIDVLREEIRIDKEATAKFFALIDEIYFDSATKQLRRQLDYNFKIELDRLTENPDEETITKDSCPYGILHGRIFSDNNCSDDQDAIEILGAWGLFYIKDYQEAGLLPEVPQSKLDLWQKQISRGNYYTAYNLARMGFCSIADFKRKKIYNKALLMEFLSQPEIRERIRFSPDSLEGSLAELGLFSAAHFQEIGLFADMKKEGSGPNYVDSVVPYLDALNRCGISHPSDLEKHQIYDKNSLKAHLARKE